MIPSARAGVRRAIRYFAPTTKPRKIRPSCSRSWAAFARSSGPSRSLPSRVDSSAAAAMTQRRDDERRRVAPASLGQHEPEHQPDRTAQAGGRGAEGRGQRVGGEQQRAVDRARQRRGQRREQEPVDRQVDQRQHVDRRRDARRQHDDRDRGREPDPHEVADEEHLPPPPPVQQHAGPRSDDRERQQQHRERDRDPGRRARLLRGEEEQGRQARPGTCRRPPGSRAGRRTACGSPATATGP